MFSCEFCEISKNIFLTEYPQATASEISGQVKSCSDWHGFSSNGGVTECEDGSVVAVLVLGTSASQVICGVTFLLMVTFGAFRSLDKVTGRKKLPIPVYLDMNLKKSICKAIKFLKKLFIILWKGNVGGHK